MKRLRLTDGTTALLEDADHARVSHLTWSPHPKGIIHTHRDASGRRRYQLLHRLLLDARPHEVVLFFNNNPRDHRRINLIKLTKAAHSASHGRHTPKAPQHVGGVSWNRKLGHNHKTYLYARAVYRGRTVDFSTLRFTRETAHTLALQWLQAQRAADLLTRAAKTAPAPTQDATLADTLHAHRADSSADTILRGEWLATDYDTLRQHSHAYAAHG
jgi:hypothetical protein